MGNNNEILRSQQQARTAAERAARSLGPLWRTFVWPNLSWHWLVYLPLGSRKRYSHDISRIEVRPSRDGYSASLELRGGGIWVGTRTVYQIFAPSRRQVRPAVRALLRRIDLHAVRGAQAHACALAAMDLGRNRRKG